MSGEARRVLSMASREEMSLSFGAEAGLYQAGRPEYPAEAAAWLLEPVSAAALRVADVGAGTGKLTRALIAAGASEVTAVEPDAAMLGVLRESTDVAAAVEGTAEHLPLADASMDAVVFGQAWHWVEPVTASLEVGRVLRPGGVLGLVWNIRDTSEPWVRRLSELMAGSAAEQMVAAAQDEYGGAGIPVGAPFEALETHEWSWLRPMTRERLLSNVRSRSAVITAAPDDRDRILADVEALADEVGMVGDDVVQMPYRTVAYRALRP